MNQIPQPPTTGPSNPVQPQEPGLHLIDSLQPVSATIETPSDTLPIPDLVSEARPQDLINSFTTSKGSIYTYNEDGHTTRFKAVSNEEQPRQDLTVFVDVGVRDIGRIAGAYLLRSSTGSTKVAVVEMQPDGTSRVITDSKEIRYPDQLHVASTRRGGTIVSKPASLFPRVGAYAFDSRRYEENGITRTERHLGYKVTKIQYK